MKLALHVYYINTSNILKPFSKKIRFFLQKNFHSTIFLDSGFLQCSFPPLILSVFHPSDLNDTWCRYIFITLTPPTVSYIFSKNLKKIEKTFLIRARLDIQLQYGSFLAYPVFGRIAGRVSGRIYGIVYFSIQT